MLRFIQSPVVRHVLSFCVAYAGSRFLLASVGFRYDLFGEPFNAAKLAVDFGVWVLIYMIVLRALTRGASQQRSGDRRPR
jgi:hypothetical protein